MSPSSKKSGGGPRTAKGKSISSQNALVHGATSNNVVGEDQKELVEQYVQELTTYYLPESPLEKLQIQRIALCKAKLDALYEIEQVKLQIASEGIKGDQNLVIGKVYSIVGITRSFALNLSNKKSLGLPMDLTPELFGIFAKEIKSAGGQLDPDDDLYTQLPRLGEFITAAGKRLKIPGYQVILRIGSSIQKLLDEKNTDYRELDELMKLGLDAMRSRARGDDAYVFKTNKNQNEDDKDTQKINDALSAITKLNSTLIRAHEVSKEFERMQELMLRSVTLSGEESDRLLRYQTTWERRLSSAIGELLVLQAKNAK